MIFLTCACKCTQSNYACLTILVRCVVTCGNSKTAWLAVGVILQVKRFCFCKCATENVSFDSYYYPIIWNSALYISYRFDTVQYFKMKMGKKKKKRQSFFKKGEKKTALSAQVIHYTTWSLAFCNLTSELVGRWGMHLQLWEVFYITVQ